MRLRDTLNLIIDVLLVVIFSFICGIGFLIQYTLPPGREKILQYGNNQDLFFLGLDRHEWGSIHLIAAFILVGFLVVHILLHGKTILALARKAVPCNWLRRFLWAILGALCCLFLLVPFFSDPVREKTGDFLHRNAQFTTEEPEVNQERLPRETVRERGRQGITIR